MFLFDMFFTRLAKDFRQKELLPLKLLFFVHASTLFVLYPYLTIHMRELGINVEETAIMSAVIPVVAIVMPPIAGMVADRIGNFRILLSVFSSLGGAASLLLLLVPVGRVTVTYPESVIFSVGCGRGRDGYLDLVMSGDPPCSYVPSLRLGKIQQVEMTLEACGFICDSSIGGQVTAVLPALSPNDEKDTSQSILQTTRYDVIVGSRVPNETKETYSYTLSSEEMPQTSDTDRDLRSHRFRKNNEFYRTSVRSASNNSYFFPTTGLYNLSCVLVNTKYECSFGKNASVGGVPKVQTPRERFKTSLFLANKSNNMFLATGLSNWVATETGNGSATSKENANATCSDVYTQAGRKVSVSVPLQDPDRTVQLSSCRARCLVTAPRQEVCSNLEIEETYDISLTFWSYLAIRVFIGMIGGTAFAMFEGAVIAILREQNADYGLQRIYATIGGMISSPLSGLLIDYASRGKGYTDFRPAFYLYAGLKIASGVLMLTMNLEFKSPATNVLSDVISVIRNVEIVALFIAIFVLGQSSQNHASSHLQE